MSTTFAWDEDLHPREGGRFAPKDKDEQETTHTGRQPAKYDDPQKTVAAIVGDGTHKVSSDYIVKGVGDPQGAEVNRVQGFDGLPTVGDAAAVQAVVDAGGVEMYRGVSSPEFADQFKTGTFYASTGGYGNGSYFSTERDRALGFYAGAEEGNLIHAALAPDARVIEEREACELAREAVKQADADHMAWYDSVRDNPPPNASEQFVNRGVGRTILNDQARAAAAAGYDALHSDTIWVILNRTALTVEQ